MALPVLSKTFKARSFFKVFDVSRSFRTWQSDFSVKFSEKRFCLIGSRIHFSQSTDGLALGRKGWSQRFKKISLVIGIGMVAGSGYGLLKLNAAPSRNDRLPTIMDITDGSNKNAEMLHPPEVKKSRTVDGPTSFLDLELMLFQYQSCPFCCKVRAFLEYYGLPFTIVEVNSVWRNEIKFSKYKKVPILLVKDSTGSYQQLNDSTAIVSILASLLRSPENGLMDIMPSYKTISYKDENEKEVTEVQNRYFLMFGEEPLSIEQETRLKEEREWRKWVDNHLVHIISPNIYRTRDEAKETFQQFSKNGRWEETFSNMERSFIINFGALAMYFISKRLKKKYNLYEDVRQSLYESANVWMKAVGQRSFMGGAQPDLSDLAVYGVLNSFEGCRAFEDMLQNTKIGPWYAAVRECVSEHAASKWVEKPVIKKDV